MPKQLALKPTFSATYCVEDYGKRSFNFSEKGEKTFRPRQNFVAHVFRLLALVGRCFNPRPLSPVRCCEIHRRTSSSSEIPLVLAKFLTAAACRASSCTRIELRGMAIGPVTSWT